MTPRRVGPRTVLAGFVVVFLTLTTAEALLSLPAERALGESLRWTLLLGLALTLFSIVARLATRLGWSLLRECMVGASVSSLVFAFANVVEVLLQAPNAREFIQLIESVGGSPGNISIVFAIDGILVGTGIFGLWMLFFRYPALHALARERELEAERLRAEADVAELRARLAPHFLLNALHTTSALVVGEPHRAQEVLVALGDLLRDVLEERTGGRTIAHELGWLERYTSIVRARFGDEIRFTFDVDDGVREVPIPFGLLQPLVENAVEHGALREPRQRTADAPSEVRISARGSGGRLVLRVEDDGPGSLAYAREGGVGLSIVRKRLALLPGGATLRIDRVGAMTIATVELALRAR